MNEELAQALSTLKALVDSLPKCSHCEKTALRAYARGGDRYCDEHGAIWYAAPAAPEYPRAIPLRAAIQLLARYGSSPTREPAP